MKIYAISSGSYSDYSVDAVFSTREKAEAYMAAVHHDWNDVEEYELDPPEAEQLREGLKPWSVDIQRDGTVWHAHEKPAEFWGIRSAHVLIKVGHKDGLDIFALRVSCMARDKTHAVKIANEKRAEVIAMGRW